MRMLLNFLSKTRKIIRSPRVQCAKSLVLLRKTHFSSRNPAVYFEISFVNRIFADIKSAILAYKPYGAARFFPRRLSGRMRLISNHERCGCHISNNNLL